MVWYGSRPLIPPPFQLFERTVITGIRYKAKLTNVNLNECGVKRYYYIIFIVN